MIHSSDRGTSLVPHALVIQRDATGIVDDVFGLGRKGQDREASMPVLKAELTPFHRDPWKLRLAHALLC